MKKFLKVLGILLGLLLLVVVIAYLYINTKGIPSYEPQTMAFKASGTPQAIARGEKLANMLCAGCHLNNETHTLSGKRMQDAPPEFGTIYSANITKHKTHGIGTWTDGELLYLLRTGIKRDGKYAPPYMAKFPHMADEDIDAIISFLRSSQPLVTSTNIDMLDSDPSFLTKLMCNVAWKPLPLPEHTISMPDTNNPKVLGEYLAHNLDCFSCHSASFKTNDYLNPPQSEGYFAGGNLPLDLQGRPKPTSNLTPDKETGIGNWSEERFIRALKYGLVEGEPALTYPMMPYSQLSDKEAAAIYAYLQSIPPINNKVERKVYE